VGELETFLFKVKIWFQNRRVKQKKEEKSFEKV